MLRDNWQGFSKKAVFAHVSDDDSVGESKHEFVSHERRFGGDVCDRLGEWA